MKRKKSKRTQKEHPAKNKGISMGLSLAMLMTTALYPSAALGADIGGGLTTESYSLVNKVEHFGGSNRYETAAKVAQEGWQASDFAILAGGRDSNLVDALAAAPLAKFKNAPILLTESGSLALNSSAEAELKRLGTKTVYIVSGEGVIAKPVVEQLAGMGIDVIKLGGDNRWETAVNIAKELGNFTQVVVATGLSYADAASMASVAAAKGMPILLTNKNTLPIEVKTYLTEIKDQLTQTYVIGGEGIISNQVMNMFPNPKRIAGSNRYETNLAILQHFTNELKATKTYLANGRDGSLVDALVGSSLAALSEAPIVLIGESIPERTRDFAEKNLSPYMVALGGETILPTSLISPLTTAIDVAMDGVVVGSDNLALPKTFEESVTVSGDKVKLQNAILNHSVYVKGDEATLENVTVKGTVFLDPGAEGNANLNQVNANKIVVLSGAKESIHILNSEAETLIVSSDNEVRVESSGSTKVGNTVVRSYAILDAAGGTLGTINVASAAGQAPVITLVGTFDQPIVVSGAVTLKADPAANVAKVEVAPESRGLGVTLEGNFKAVEVNKEAHLYLGANASVGSLVTNAKADLNVASGAKVDSFDNKGQNVNVIGDGARNIPPSGQVNPSTGGSGSSGDSDDGNSGGSGPSDAQLANEAIAAAKVLLPATLNPNADTDTNLLTLLNTLEGMTAKGVTLSITSTVNANVASNGTLTFGKAEVTGNVVISIAKSGGTTDTKTIAVTVPVISDAKAVAKAKEALTFELIKGENASLDQIVKSLILIPDDSSFTDYGVNISWETTNSAVDVESGKVSRPTWEEFNASGTLKAVFSKGEVIERKDFTITVPKIDALVYEDNNDPEKATTITTDGVAQTHMLSPEGEGDWIKFEAEAGAMYTLRTSRLIPEYNDDYALDTVIEVYNGSGEILESDDDDDYGYGYWSRLDWVAPADGTYYIKVTELNDTVGQYDVSVSKVAPRSILEVSADSWDLNELYVTGEILEVYVIFSEDVVVTGTPRIKLATGTQEERYATYKEGSGSNVLTFEYTVQEGDHTSHLETAGLALELNGGSIKTMTEEEMVLTLPELGSLSSLGANAPISLNTVLPEYVYNENHTSITIELNGALSEENVLTGLEDAFSVSELTGKTYEVTAVEVAGSNDEILLRVSDFSESEGRLRVSFDSRIGELTDQFGNTLEDFSLNFTPDFDTIPPAFFGPYPLGVWGEDLSLTLFVQADEVGKGYFVVVPAGDEEPSAEQVKAGMDAEGNPLADDLKGQFDLLEGSGVNSELSITIVNLESTDYAIYMVCEDLAGNLQGDASGVTLLSPEEFLVWGNINQWVNAYFSETGISPDQSLDAYEEYLDLYGQLEVLPDTMFKDTVLVEFGYITEAILDALVNQILEYEVTELTQAQLDEAYAHYEAALNMVEFLEFEDEEEKADLIEDIRDAWTPVADQGRPIALVSAVSFSGDTDTDFAQIAGTLTWTAVAPEANVEGYRIYFVDEEGNPIGEAIGMVEGNEATTFAIPENTEVPGSTSSLSVYSYNKYGESTVGTEYAYFTEIDEDSTSVGPNNVSVTISDNTLTLNWTPAVWSSAVLQKIYILPKTEPATELKTSIQAAVAEIDNNTGVTWSGNIAELKDSLGNSLQSGWYKAYVVASTELDANYYSWIWNSVGKEFEIQTVAETPEEVEIGEMDITSSGIVGEAGEDSGQTTGEATGEAPVEEPGGGLEEEPTP